MNGLFKTMLKNYPPAKFGKVRDNYCIDDKLLIIASDRISAFDVIMDQTVPNKGKILTQISNFWFQNTAHIIKNHLFSTNIDDVPNLEQQEKSILDGRFMLVNQAKVFPIECVVRGYLAGSGWQEYNRNRQVCGIDIPDGLTEFSKLPFPIFTPATKAEEGHDENIDLREMKRLIGDENAEFLKNKSVELYNYAADFLLKRGIILADTKFEFGINPNDEIILIDEALTPDSSRFWLAESYEPGKNQYNFDKQILRDYLLSIHWNKTPPPPQIPEDVIKKTIDKYKEAYFRITGKEFLD